MSISWELCSKSKLPVGSDPPDSQARVSREGLEQGDIVILDGLAVKGIVGIDNSHALVTHLDGDKHEQMIAERFEQYPVALIRRSRGQILCIP